ncbi:hypothetical protein Aca07nite_37020 [Actinoplanes capillaceus]|uniref:GDSL-like Lipase/Acylhydrolase family protein n=1 Tax=Actinoplanes campanulatus TaxID=113559 RepID=A0ABQ3WJM6_9ACTN|nr:hypothetical protein Aca07nite_37020 [Actinoplanes capillaceus]
MTAAVGTRMGRPYTGGGAIVCDRNAAGRRFDGEPNPRRPDGTEDTTHLDPAGAALVGALVADLAYTEVPALRGRLL